MNPYSVWRKRLRRIYDEQLCDLIVNRHIFHQAVDVWIPYEGRRDAAELAYWMGQNYVVFAATALRRIAEPPPKPPKRPRKGQKTLSLAILLDDLANNNKLLSRQWYLNMYPSGYMRDDFGNRHFTTLAGNDAAKCMPRRRIRADIAAIRRATQPIKRLVDKAIAHTEEDRRKMGRPRSDQIDEAVELIADVYSRYYLLLNARSMDPFDEAESIDVTSDLRKIWP